MATNNPAKPNFLDVFVKRSSLPALVDIPEVKARILIDGNIQAEGFAARGVLSPCSMVAEKGDGELYFPRNWSNL